MHRFFALAILAASAVLLPASGGEKKKDAGFPPVERGPEHKVLEGLARAPHSGQNGRVHPLVGRRRKQPIDLRNRTFRLSDMVVGHVKVSAGTGLAAMFLLFLPGRKRYRTALGLGLVCVSPSRAVPGRARGHHLLALEEAAYRTG